MKKISARELRKLYLDYYVSKGHTVIPSASLIPENDPTVLFTTAGMHPLVPYLLGEIHPAGKRLTNCQKCIRTSDIDEVGDNTHLTYFEMLGNWSLGDYFKEKAIGDSFEFLTKVLEIPQERLYFTVFIGDENSPKDTESYNIWRSLGVEESHLFYLPKKNNWWGLAANKGPCGPDTEMFIDTLKPKCSDDCSPACDCGKYVEIWNDVFMQYNAHEDGTLELLAKPNVDTGMGFERVMCLVNGYESVYDTELFANLFNKLTELSNIKYSDNKKSYRIVMDHLRTAVFVLGDNKHITPSNTEAGYILRRVIRRLIRHLKNLNINDNMLSKLAVIIIDDYKDIYVELDKNKDFILHELDKEEIAFNKTIKDGIKEFEKATSKMDTTIISGDVAFRLYDTYGFPLEFTVEMAAELNLSVDVKAYEERFKEHQEKSRMGAEQKFKGGLADDSAESTRYHTAAHILLATLRSMFGEAVLQRGANITPERLRFDFSFERKLTDEEVKLVELKVNEVIKSNIIVTREEMSYDDAKKTGAMGIFEDKYGNNVSVYTIGNISKEICGGPHVNNTNELGVFKIVKEESSSAGVRRIKAILE